MADRLFHLPGKSSFVHYGGKALRICNLGCQSAPKFDPRSASHFDPLKRRALAVAVVLAPSQLIYAGRILRGGEAGRPAGDAGEQVAKARATLTPCFCTSRMNMVGPRHRDGWTRIK